MSPHCLTPNETGRRRLLDFTPFLSSPGAGVAILTVCEDYTACVSLSVHTLCAELPFLSRAKWVQRSPQGHLGSRHDLFMNIHWPWLESNLWPFRYRILRKSAPRLWSQHLYSWSSFIILFFTFGCYCMMSCLQSCQQHLILWLRMKV